MGRPSLSRAVPMGLIGFLVGSLFVMVMRDLQGIQPAWDSGVAIILSAFTAAGFFLWGIGAFTPSMSVHGDPHEEADESGETPFAILKGYTALITTITLLAVLGFATYALLPGTPTITQTDRAAASGDRYWCFHTHNRRQHAGNQPARRLHRFRSLHHRFVAGDFGLDWLRFLRAFPRQTLCPGRLRPRSQPAAAPGYPRLRGRSHADGWHHRSLVWMDGRPPARRGSQPRARRSARGRFSGCPAPRRARTPRPRRGH